MSQLGLLDGRRVELINGEIIEQHIELIHGDILEQPPMNEPHAQAIQLATYALLNIFPPIRFTIRTQLPMKLSESRPFPDLVVVPGTARQVASHPTGALLVIEVSDTTLDFDRGEKADLYASHGIADYWIVNVNAKCVEVYRDPTILRGREFRYGSLVSYGANDIISPLASPEQSIRVSDLLP